jgi:hypothetical protein
MGPIQSAEVLYSILRLSDLIRGAEQMALPVSLAHANRGGGFAYPVHRAGIDPMFLITREFQPSIIPVPAALE